MSLRPERFSDHWALTSILVRRLLRDFHVRLRCGGPVAEWRRRRRRRPGELHTDAVLEHSAAARWRHQIWVVGRLVRTRGRADRLERDTPRRRPSQAVVRLARVRA